MNSRVLPLVLSLASTTGIAQEKPKADPTRAFLQGIRDDTRWDTHATRLVQLGGAAAAPVGAELRRAAKEKNQKICTRLLIVLDRLGIDGAAALPDLFADFGAFDEPNVRRAFQTAASITPLGPSDAATQFKNSLRHIMPMIHGQAGPQGPGSLLQQFTGNFQVAMSKQRLRPAMAFEVAFEQAKIGTTTIGQYQQLATYGKAAAPAATLLGERLLRMVEGPLPDAGKAVQRPGKTAPSKKAEAEVARHIAIALTKITQGTAPAAIAHAYLMQHDTLEGLRQTAGQELMMAGPHLEATLPILRRALAKPGKGQPALSPATLRIALNCLAMLGAKAADLLPAIDALAEAADAKVAARAKAAAKRIRAALDKKPPQPPVAAPRDAVHILQGTADQVRIAPDEIALVDGWIQKIQAAHPAVADIRAAARWKLGEVLLFFQADADKTLAQAKWQLVDGRLELQGSSGIPALDALQRELGTRLQRFGLPGATSMAMAQFPEDRDVLAVARRYAALDCVKAAEGNMQGNAPQGIHLLRRDGRLLFVFRRSWGDCPAGCIHNHYHYFEVDPKTPTIHAHGELRPKDARNGAIHRWNIPARFAVKPFLDSQSLLQATRHPQWWTARHAVEVLGLLLGGARQPWLHEDFEPRARFDRVRRGVQDTPRAAHRALIDALPHADTSVRAAALDHLQRLSKQPHGADAKGIEAWRAWLAAQDFSRK